MEESNIKMYEVKDKINNFFSSSESFSNVYVSEVDLEVMRIRSSENKVTLKVYWDNLFDYIFKDLNSLEELAKFCENKNSIKDMFDEMSYDMIYRDKNNELLKIWGVESNSLKDRWINGFYSERGKYAEFSLEENEDICSSIYENKLPKMLLLNFGIGKVQVKVSKPSQIFKLIFLRLNRYKVERGWSHNITIQLDNVSKTNLNSYLHQALFILNLYNPYVLLFGGGTFIRNFPNVYDYDESSWKVAFPETLYVEPICYYNEAMNCSNETCFLHYYKVLEYFFIINQSENLINVIDKYKKVEKQINETSNSLKQDINMKITKNKSKLINDIGNIYNLGENECLNKLLNNENIKNDVEKVIYEYFYDDLIQHSKNDNISIGKISITDFAKQLYLYRNSIVHGKNDYKFNSRIPNLLYEDEEDEQIKYWNIIIQKLALICIKYFCFNGNEAIKFEI